MSKRVRVLLFGCDAQDAAEVGANLVENGFEVSGSSSRQEFEGLLAVGNWDILVTDLVAPGYAPLEAVRETRAAHPDLPIVILTGQGSEELAVEAFRCGIRDYVVKNPENAGELHRVLDRLLTEGHPGAGLCSREENLLNKLIRNSIDIVAVVDAKGNEVFVSDSVERITGFLPRDLLGSNCFRHVHPEDCERIRRSMAELLDRPGGSIRGEYRHHTKDGRWVHLEAVGSNFLDDPEINGLVLNIRDITARKLHEESLQRSKIHLDKLVSNSNDILVIMDETGRELYVSEAIEKITGFSVAEVAGTVCFDHFHLEDRKKIAALLQKGLSHPGKSARIEYRRKKKDGGWVDLEAIGTNFLEDPDIGGIVINARDITERKRTEDALRKSEDRLNKMMRNSNDYLAILDLDGNEKFVSPSIERITGYRPEEVQGTNCFQYYHPDDVEIINRTVRRLIDSPDLPHRAEYRRRKKDGSWIEMEAICSNLLDDPDIQGVVINARDITERRKAERELRDTQARYEKLARLLPEAVWEADLEGRLRFVNRKGLDLMGYTQEDIDAGLNGFEFFAPPGRQICMEKTMAVLHGAETEITEYEMLRKDGTTFPALVHSDLVREGGVPAYFIGIGIDITEPKRAEAECRLLAAAMEQTGDIVIVTDAEGRILHVNPSFERITGYSCQEVLGLTPRILKSGEHSESFYRSLWQVLTEGKTWQGRFINRRRNGELYPEEATISPVFNDSGEIINYVAVKRDITEQLKISQEKLELEQQFHQAQKMESVGLLAGGVAHDLNNLLTPILGYGEMLLGDPLTSEARREYANGIVQAGRGARDVVNQLLAFSRKQALEIKLIDLNQLVVRFEKLLRRVIPEDIGIKIVTCARLPLVMGDINQLEQVVMNLAVNARDAMPGGGVLTIETGMAEMDEDSIPDGRELAPGRFATLKIEDTGLGMDERTRAQIFEPFFSTKPKHKGSGLGLATVYGIVRQHGGDIEVRSQPLQGSTFTVFLPAAAASTLPAENILPDEDDLLGTETILLVEDDQHVRDMSLYFLKRKGYAVLTAESGEQALEFMRDSGSSVDLLLTDVVMTGINGRELYDWLSLDYPDLKVIYMSGYTGEVLTARGVVDESINFVQKPFSVQALAAKIRGVLGPAADRGK